MINLFNRICNYIRLCNLCYNFWVNLSNCYIKNYSHEIIVLNWFFRSGRNNLMVRIWHLMYWILILPVLNLCENKTFPPCPKVNNIIIITRRTINQLSWSQTREFPVLWVPELGNSLRNVTQNTKMKIIFRKTCLQNWSYWTRKLDLLI